MTALVERDGTRTAIRLVAVSKDYFRGGSRVRALDCVSLEIEKGEFCAILGPSGSGKSTLLNLLAGIDRPSSGEVFLEGRDATSLSDNDWTCVRREMIGLVFQAFHLIPGLTAEENVALPLLLNGVRGPEVRRRAIEELALVGLADRARHRPGSLSGGEQQRVAIARALVHRPRVLLADEPTGNLDSSNADAIIALLHILAGTGGQTVVMVTHSQTAAERADRVYNMKDGRIESVEHRNPFQGRGA